MSLTAHDMFCGAGGSTLGAVMAGVTPVVGMNHWHVACQSYEANHAKHGAVSACVDVVTQDPRRYPAADMLLASPECTHHSYARGKPKDDPSLFDPQGDQGAERSRATMWDVVRFAEAHQYRACIVENVEAAIKWGLPRSRKLGHGEYGPLFAAWLNAMEALDYRYRVVHLNSMVCGVPQSRDRIYVVFWKKGQRAPDLDVTALAWCPRCDDLVQAGQRWKRPGSTTGTYRQGYVYTCPDCDTECALAVRPAASAIDWSLTAERIGDRKTPLKAATMERIRRGLERLRERPATVRLQDGLVVQVGGNLFERPGYARAWPTSEPMPTVTGTADRALVMPVTHHGTTDRSRRAASEVVPTICAQSTKSGPGELAVVVTQRGHVWREGGVNEPTLVDGEALDTISAQGNHHGLVITCRGNAQGADRHPTRPDSEALTTVTASGNHHGLLIANYGSVDGPENKQGWARHVDDHPAGTVTATDSHALLTYRGREDVRRPSEPLSTVATIEQHALMGEVTQEEVDSCTFRMLQPEELKRASGFTPDYLLHGTKRDQVCQVGNAVTAPAEAELVRRVMASLDEEGVAA